MIKFKKIVCITAFYTVTSYIAIFKAVTSFYIVHTIHTYILMCTIVSRVFHYYKTPLELDTAQTVINSPFDLLTRYKRDHKTVVIICPSTKNAYNIIFVICTFKGYEIFSAC